MQDLREEFHLKTPLVLGVCLNLVARTTPSKANRINNLRLSCRKRRAVLAYRMRKKKKDMCDNGIETLDKHWD